MYSADRQICETLCTIGHSFFIRGLSGGASGNISARLSEGFVATPTGCTLGDITPEKLSILDAEGQHISGPKPTKELFVHLACYAHGTNCGAVVHLHSPYGVLWSCLMDIDPTDAVPAYTPYGLMRYGRVALAPYHTPGSHALAEAVKARMPQHKALLLANHGTLMTGRTLQYAADSMEELESSCRLALQLRGLPARLLSAEEQNILLCK